MNARDGVVGIAALVGVGLALAWIGSALGARQVVEARIDGKLHELEYTYQSAANRAVLEEQLTETRRMLDAVEQRLPSRIDVAALEQALRARAVESGVALEELRVAPRGEEPKEFYSLLPIRLRLSGPNQAMYAMLADFAQSEPVRHVASLELVPRDDARDALVATVVIHQFRYLDEGDAP